jgi:SPP1 gp7 family putative phage head morphogenesis protein
MESLMASNDPTQTVTLRRLFVAQMNARFSSISKLIVESIVKNDCFDLGPDRRTDIKAILFPPPKSWIDDLFPIGYKRFKFMTDPQKVEAFMAWLKEMEEKAIFQIVNYPRVGSSINPVWTNIYIAQSYQHGVLWARNKMRSDAELLKRLGITIGDLPVDGADIVDAIQRGVHADRVGVLFSRVYSDLKGVTEAMDLAIARILSESIILGKPAREIASLMVNKVKTIGKHRATLIARTETIRAHHLASIQEYRNAGVVGVKVEAEWHTARDGRVCELCAPLDYSVSGKVWSLDEIEDKIPVHPQCRCAALPHLPDIKG